MEEYLPYTSTAYFSFECINAKYSSLESFDVTLSFIWLKIPTYFNRDWPISSICLFHINVSPSVTPRYLKKETLSILINSVWIVIEFVGIGLYTKWNNTNFVLSLFMIRLLLTHQYISVNSLIWFLPLESLNSYATNKEQYCLQREAHVPSLQSQKI